MEREVRITVYLAREGTQDEILRDVARVIEGCKIAAVERARAALGTAEGAEHDDTERRVQLDKILVGTVSYAVEVYDWEKGDDTDE